MALEKVTLIRDLACEYIGKLYAVKEDWLKWHEEVRKTGRELANQYDGKRNGSEPDLLLPKTPIMRNKRQNRSGQKRDHENCVTQVAEQAATTAKTSPTGKLPVICLARIDENTDMRPIVDQDNEKPKPPVKPPRHIQSSKLKPVNSLTPTAVVSNSAPDSPPPPDPIYKSAATLTLSTEKRRSHAISKVTCSPHKIMHGPALLKGHTSKRRSSRVRQKQRVSNNFSLQQRLRSSQHYKDIDEDASSGLSDGKNDVNDYKTENVAEPTDAKIKQNRSTGSRSRSSSKGNRNQQNHDVVANIITVNDNTESSNEDGLKIKRIKSAGAHEENDKQTLAENNDSVISKTPSPVCPPNKIVCPKGIAKPTTSTPFIGSKCITPLCRPYQPKCRPSSHHQQNKVPSKMFSSTANNSKLGRSNSFISNGSRNILKKNSSLTQVSPMYMTPQDKREKCKKEQMLSRELKAKEILKKRDEILKRKIQEQKRKREEKHLRVIRAKEEKQKKEATKLAKLREEEEKRSQLKSALKMKVQPHEKQRMKEAENASFQKLYDSKTKGKKAQCQEKKTKENEKPVSDEEHEENAEELTAEVQKPTEESCGKSVALNVTVVLSSCNESKDNYEITPQRIYPIIPKDSDNYDISDLQEDNSTDDEQKPKKKVPNWAQGRVFKLAVLEQFRKIPDPTVVFPPSELMLRPPLEKIFRKKKKTFKRTSSAVWTSPFWKDTSK